MRFLRLVTGVIVILVLIFLAGFLLPSGVTISKSVLINASPSRIDSQITDFGQWKNWYPAFKSETVNIVNNSPKPGVISSVSLKDTRGKQLDLDLVKMSRDTIVVAVASKASDKVNYQFILIPHSDGQTQLVWNVNTSLGWYPWEKLKGIFLDKISGPQYEAALVSLKAAVEK